jgi:hypothetical protein
MPRKRLARGSPTLRRLDTFGRQGSRLPQSGKAGCPKVERLLQGLILSRPQVRFFRLRGFVVPLEFVVGGLLQGLIVPRPQVRSFRLRGFVVPNLLCSKGLLYRDRRSVLSGCEGLLCRWSLLLGGYYKGLLYRDRRSVLSGCEGLLCRTCCAPRAYYTATAGPFFQAARVCCATCR